VLTYALGVELSRDRQHASIAAAGLQDGWPTIHLLHYLDDVEQALPTLLGLHNKRPAAVRSAPEHRIEVLDPDEFGMVPDRPVYADQVQTVAAGRSPVVATVIDRRGPACTLIRPLTKARIKVTAADSGMLAEAHGLFLDGLASGRLRVVPDHRLTAAIQHGEQRHAGDASAWSMRASTTDTAPAKAAELALLAWLTVPRPPDPDIF
jgi:hypothetical protein